MVHLAQVLFRFLFASLSFSLSSSYSLVREEILVALIFLIHFSSPLNHHTMSSEIIGMNHISSVDCIVCAHRKDCNAAGWKEERASLSYQTGVAVLCPVVRVVEEFPPLWWWWLVVALAVLDEGDTLRIIRSWEGVLVVVDVEFTGKGGGFGEDMTW